MAGWNPLPEEMPVEEREAPPEVPKLSICSFNDGKFVIPGTIVSQWYHHDKFGERFKAFYDAAIEDTYDYHAVNKIIIFM